MNTCVDITEKNLFCLQMRLINTSVVFLTFDQEMMGNILIMLNIICSIIWICSCEYEICTPFSNLNTCYEFPEKKDFYLSATNENYQNFCRFFDLLIMRNILMVQQIIHSIIWICSCKEETAAVAILSAFWTGMLILLEKKIFVFVYKWGLLTLLSFFWPLNVWWW